MKKEYCPYCDKECDYDVEVETRHFKVKGDEISATIKVARCKDCGEEIYVEEIEKYNDVAIYDVYKKKHHLLTSDEIKKIRIKRGLSQIKFARLLKIGAKDITRYENGAIQSEAINLLIKLADNDFVYNNMINPLKEDSLNNKETLVIKYKIQTKNEYTFTEENSDDGKLYACAA